MPTRIDAIVPAIWANPIRENVFFALLLFIITHPFKIFTDPNHAPRDNFQCGVQHSLSDSDKRFNKLLSDLYERDYGPASVPSIYKEKDYSNLPGQSFITAILNCGALIDLTAVLLDNETDEDFVVSDNPVVFQNPLIEKYALQNCSGFCTRGLQIYYPLTPRRMVCLYDSRVYKYLRRLL